MLKTSYDKQIDFIMIGENSKGKLKTKNELD